MTISPELDERFRAAAAAEGLLDVAYDVTDSPVGPLLVAVSERGLCRISFDAEPERQIESLARSFGARVLRSRRPLDDVKRELHEYFSGERRAFDLPVDIERLTPFNRSVLEELARVPYGSLILMIVPSLIVSAIWAYRPTFQGIFLWATGVIAITFLGTVIAAAIMPWRRKDIYENSPIARFKVAGMPVITITGVVSAIFLVFMLAEWSFNAVYGTSFSLNASSPIYFLVTYLVAIAIYVVARVVRKRQGIDLARIHREIPVE